jgi:catechol 2,3-dioxygenase-like lactoylglutathione lyase family enzyme
MFEKIDYTMIIVSDMARSVEFYADKLGIPLKFQSPEWTEFDTPGTTLALHGGGISQSAANDDSKSKIAGTCSIGFNVDDLEKTYIELKSKGVNFIMAPTQRDNEGIKLAVCIDPDGLPVSFAQTVAKWTSESA